MSTTFNVSDLTLFYVDGEANLRKNSFEEGRAVLEQGSKTWAGPKTISIVGCTGSIGTQVLVEMDFPFNMITCSTIVIM